MELPSEIIKEYARFITRPDWCTLHKMPYYNYKYECYSKYFKNSMRIVINANNGRYLRDKHTRQAFLSIFR